MKFGAGLALSLSLGLACLGGWCLVRSQKNSTPLDARSDAEVAPVKTPHPAPGILANALETRFSTRVQPFLKRYCYSCHRGKNPEAALDLTRDSTVKAIAGNPQQWELVLQRLEAAEMPPEEAPRHPSPDERATVTAWIRDLRASEARRTADDPGPVLARRLSNAAFDYTIRDLTGVDIGPTRSFPIDPANEAGFDNSGESLTMSPALLKKYLEAARLVADHVVLKPDGFVFAPHPVVTETDRDHYCVKRIIDFYTRHQVDLADYFLAAWKYHHRAALGRPAASLDTFATEAGLSAKYLAMLWPVLSSTEMDPGLLAAVRKRWRDLPLPEEASLNAVRLGCERVRDLVVRLRKPLKPNVGKLRVAGISDGSQPLVLWRNRQLASRHRSYSGEVFADLRKLAEQLKGADAPLAKLLGTNAPAASEQRLRAALERFCSVFPGAFVVTDRGPYFNPNAAGQGRPLTAGFHLMQGYFRDDAPLCELILDARQKRELDDLWHELNFITLAPLRQYKDFIFFERAEPPRYMREAEFDFARSEDKDATSEAKMTRLAKAYLAKAAQRKPGKEALDAIATYFIGISADIRGVEAARLAAEPSHLEALVRFTERAYRRPLSQEEKDEVRGFYSRLRRQDKLGHEEALRDTLATVLMSPHFCYRFDRAAPGTTARRVSDHALASRLSYFLWSSMPDAELLAHAAKGDLHTPEVLKAQARRMLRDPRVRGLATEFFANLLDFRRFEEHNSVDRQRFPTFTNGLRQAMFEEPIRYFIDVAQRNRSVLDLLYGDDTFVNRTLARHYGIPASPPSVGQASRLSLPASRRQARRLSHESQMDDWFHVRDARPYARGGVLPMAVFLTRNAPGLRTSPVKRGYWVVRRLLGEKIPPPPPTVPELPKDEAKLGDLTLPQLLARHRENKSCAGCHRRFDAIGLAFEGFGPIGERRTKDLGGRPVQTKADFPDGKEREGLAGLREYLREKRQADFVANLCRKLFSYGLGRGLLLSDNPTIDAMQARWARDGYTFATLVEAIVTSPQFQNKRGRDDPRER
jgi:hypothetical protein